MSPYMRFLLAALVVSASLLAAFMSAGVVSLAIIAGALCLFITILFVCGDRGGNNE